MLILRRSIELMKPVTWFAPSWAFLCGSIASGASQWTVTDVGRIALGTLLAGPILCGMSQVVNDYCDRDVDAINEPQRLIPSGLVSTRQVFITVGVLVVLGLGIALFLGQYVALMTAIGMVLAVIYSAGPIRAKRNGWIGNTIVAVFLRRIAVDRRSSGVCAVDVRQRVDGGALLARRPRYHDDQ
jgi:chlorophyll synthase